jgi:phosphodiesterase/alkaline phosphatase D-like protein
MRGSRAIACAVATLGLMLLLAAAVRVSAADAAYLHTSEPSESFGLDGTAGTEFRGGGMAVDPVSHRLYAFLNSNGRVSAFETPTPGTHTSVGGKFPRYAGPNEEYESSPEKTSIAVDPTTGNFYTTDKADVRGFNSSGEALPGFPLTVGLSEPCGVTTDGEGNLWVGDENEHQIREYNPAGELLRAINASSVWEPEFGYGRVCNIAIDKSTGDLYFTLSGNYGANRIVWKLTAASNYNVSEVEEFVVNPTYPGIESIAIDSARHVVYLAEGSKIDAYNTDGVLLQEFGTTLPELVSVAIDESTGLLYATYGEWSKAQIFVFDPVIVPDAATGEPTGDSQVSGTTGTAGGPAVTECKFEWGPTKAYGETPVPCSPAPPYGESETVTADLPGLSKESTYHYRLVATNSNGTNIGVDRTITPHNVPFLRTMPASSVERTCATFNGAYEGNGEDTEYNFEWGTTASYGNTAFDSPEDAGSGTGPQQESFQLCGLQPATTYHFRFTAKNGIGPSTGKDASFTTGQAVIGIGTDPATEIGGVSGTINGHWTGDGSATSYYFEWGFSKNYEHTTPVIDAGTGTGPESGSAELTDLFQNTVYHYRIVVTDGLGTTKGPDRSFRTLVLSSFTYLPTKKYETTSAEVRATVNPENAGPTTFHFEYGPTTSYGTSTPEEGPVGSDNTAHPVSAEISGLSAGQTYHYRVVGTSPAGVSYGSDQTFTTIPNPPTVVGEAVSSFGSTEATLTGEARPGFGPTVIFFSYKTEGSVTFHTISSEPIGSDDSPHSATLTVTGLLPATRYIYWATAVNIAGSSVGPEQTFTTSNHPSADVSPVTAVTETTANLAGIVNPSLAATTYHFEYGTGSASEVSTPATAVGSDGLSHAVSASISGLAPGTTYKYRVTAVNAVGSTTSREGSFTTVAAKSPGGGGGTKPVNCKKGFVKKHGKCVKKPKKHKKKKQHGKAHRNG